MLQEFLEHLNAATELTAEIGARFRLGDPAEDLLARLTVCVTEIGRFAAQVGPTPPEELRVGIAQLLALLHTAASGGDDWLAEADGLELATEQLRRRVRQAYRLPPRQPT